MISENAILARAIEVLRKRLPPGWTAQLVQSRRRASTGEPDGVVRIVAPDGSAAELQVEARRRLEPRAAEELASLDPAPGSPVLAIAPWLSSTTRQILADADLSLVDLSGGVRVVLSEPGLFVETPSADRDPWPEDRRVTLRGDKAAKVAVALCTARPPIGIRELAARSGTSAGYVSKLVQMLDAQAALRRTESGQVSQVDLRRLLSRWAEDAPLDRRTATSSWLAPRGLGAMLERLRQVDARYAVTASLAASRRAPVAAPRVASVYVEDPEAFAAAVVLRPADAGANVLLLVPSDSGAFEDTWTDQGLRFAALPRVVADLLTGPGRGPAEGEALIDWMIENPEQWRG